VTASGFPADRCVLVTGANGFVGRAVSAAARAAGAEVRGVDVVADPVRGIVAGDIGRPSGWLALLDGCDVVIHTAALVTNNIDRARAWEVNVVGTRRVVDAAVGAGVGRFVHLSTMGVARFGQLATDEVARVLPGCDLDEHWPLMPTGNPYTDTKIAAEHLVLAAHAAGEIEVTVVRPADVYGPGSRPWILEPLAAIRAGRFLLPARGRGLFTPVYVDDLVRGIAAAVAEDSAAGHIVQFGGEDVVTTSEYFGHLYRMLGRSGPPPALPTPLAVAVAEAVRLGYRAAGRPTELGRGVMEMLAKTRPVSNAKAHELLGWWAEVDLEEGMRSTEAWLRSDGLLPEPG
jgi:nucleoside-diphosphate-sugar epimerase